MAARAIAASLVAAVALGLVAIAPAALAVERRGQLRAAQDSGARREGDKKTRDGGLLDDLGLGSLAKLPWDAFVLGILLAAVVGAGGGFIYAGIVGPKEER